MLELLLLAVIFGLFALNPDEDEIDVDLGDSRSQLGSFNEEASLIPDDCLSETLRMSALTMNSSLAFSDGLSMPFESTFYGGCDICHHNQNTCSRSPRQAV